MRIGLISGEYPPMEGGVGDFTHLLGRALHEAGHEVHVLTSREPMTVRAAVNRRRWGKFPAPALQAGARRKEPAPQEENGLFIHRHPLRWGPRCGAAIVAWAEAQRLDILDLQYQAAAYRLRGWINLAPRLTRRRRRIPWVTTFHDLLPPYLFPKAGRLRQEAVWTLARFSDGIIVTNGEDAHRLREELGERLPPLRTIPIGSNIAPAPPPGFDPQGWREAHGLPRGALLLGFFGFLNRSKGIETLLEAMARLRDEGHPVYLALIGGRTGSSDATNRAYAEAVEARIARLGLEARVLRTGFAAPQEVSAALLSCDLCVLPYRDGASLRRGTLHAALAHGCAVLTTEPRFPLPELTQAVALVPPERPDALHDAILRLWRDRAERARLRRAAAELARRFTWEAIAERTAAFFRELRG